MNQERRTFFGWAISAALAALAIGSAPGAVLARAPQQQKPHAQPNPLPPSHADFPLPDAPQPTKEILKHNQKQIEQDVERLYTLAQELKKDVGSTDSTAILSLGMVHKAEEIEKLARQIKNLARG